MKTTAVLLILTTNICFGQLSNETQLLKKTPNTYIISTDNLTLNAAFELHSRATATASKLNKNVAIAILDASGNIILLSKSESVGPHNTEAARKKAFTALSTKTSTLLLSKKIEEEATSKNLKTLSELLLLGGGIPIFRNGIVIGSIGVAGGGGPDNDDLIAKSASIPEAGILTSNE